MSRRDIILVAALLNAGILSVLFMMAVKVDDSQIETQPGINQMAVVTPKDFESSQHVETLEIAVLSTPSTTTDEWDKVLKDYAASVSPQTIVHEEEAAEELEKENEKFEPIKVVENKPAATVSPAASKSEFVEVKVKRGDALEKIARSNGTTIEAIKKHNNLTSDKLSVGQTLKIPTKSSTVELPKQEQPKVAEKKLVASADVEYYTIKSGDNPWKIAKQFRVKFEDLLRLNSLDEEKARNLKVGDKIRVK